MSKGESEPTAPAGADWREQVRNARRTRTRARNIRKAARHAMPWWRRVFPTWRMVLSTLLTMVLLIVAAFVALYVTVPVPGPNAAAVSQSNIYYYADGTEIGRTGPVNRASLPLSEISVNVQHAVVAAEDRTFYSNQGVDAQGILRAAWNTVTGKGLQGGSTITQQYVRSYYLDPEQTLERKLKEAVIAIKVSQTQSKDAIMAGYLNTSYFGRNAYGIKAAAQAYFGVRASQLTVGQSAYLAALLKAPSVYDVSTATPAHRAAAVARWNYVLDAMADLGYLSSRERATTVFPALRPPSPTPGVGGQAGYLIDIARRYLIDHDILDEAMLGAGGWQITTTFVKKNQDALGAAVTKVLRQLPDTRKARYIRLGAASVDPSTGKIVAAYGGPDYAARPYNDATRHDLQAGSTFKPFDLAAALQHGATTQDHHAITPRTRYDGTSRRCVTGLPARLHYCPPNEDDVDYGPISLRTAMMKSVNAVYAQVGADAGLADVRRAAIAAGLPADTPDMGATPALTLGVATPSPLDMAGAYATFDNHGKRILPWSVQTLTRNNKTYELPRHRAVQAFSRATADQVTSVLKGVVSANGTGYLATALGRPAAGKTGTTDSNLSAWFVGYTPQLSTSVAMFAENPTTHTRIPLGEAAGIRRVNGGSYPTRIWTTYMAAALKGRPVQDFHLIVPTPATHAPRTPAGTHASPTPAQTTAPTHESTSTPPPSPTAPATPTPTTVTPSTITPTTPPTITPVPTTTTPPPDPTSTAPPVSGNSTDDTG
ncbi:transglycosylase domain-containing protein [Streptomyces sp. HUAS ZL42]|uniref:transglycosylase domain-containing protein n=1 Tax=Streptomyces sp. HUAS ZL42 TaxID=3231715 RepID=UPI00345EC05E